MAQYNTINVKLSYLQHIKLKSATKNAAEINLRLSLNMIGNSTDETDFHSLIADFVQFSCAIAKFLLFEQRLDTRRSILRFC